MNRFRMASSAKLVALMLVLSLNFVGCAGPGENTHGGAPWNVQGRCPCEDGSPKKDKNCKPQPVAPAPKVEPKAVAPAPPPPAPVMDDKLVCGRLIWPTGDVKTSSVLVEKCAPRYVQIGMGFDFNIKVTNLTSTTLKNVVVTDKVASSFKVSKTTPEARSMGEVLIWQLGDLEPRATRTIVLSGTPTAPGKLENCITVTHDLDTCVAVDVIAPKLALTKTAPAEALKCDTIPVKFVVTNSGVGAARDVRIVDNLPEGMTTTDGKSNVTIDVGTLAAGQTQEYTVNTKVANPGRFVNTAKVSAFGGLTADSTTTTVVKMPVLEISKQGPAMRFVGRPIEYIIVVTNKGDGDARDTVLEDPIPAGTRSIKASDNASIADGKIVWQLGTLKPGESRKVTAEVVGTAIGTVTNTAAVRAYCAAPAQASARTDVKGIPAILLECIDIQDPVEVGANVTYVITVTNQGSMTGTGITIKCTLEDSMQYVSADGPTKTAVDASGKILTMEPLPSLAAGAKAEWKVTVKALKSSDARFRIVMNSDQIDRNVEETEATNFYE